MARTMNDIDQQISLSHAAREVLRRATAPARHAERVQTTLAAARAWDGEAAALAAIMLDLAGLGGRAGVTGAGTSRLLSALGKGRWQASDGPAYLGAATQVAAHIGEFTELTPEAVHGFVQAESGRVVTLSVLIVAALAGQPVTDHERLATSDCAPLVLLHNGAVLCRVAGELEDWAAVLDAAVARRDAVARTAWRRRIVSDAQSAVGHSRLTRDTLDKVVQVRWSWMSRLADIPLRELLGSHETPGEWCLHSLS